ncbi:hypothetical protein [Streptomyces winkii]|uniref:hypothetical protein n=1 Tax=Streptomyces winkii TaxID=3051178 RepID=UPI0028D6275D|nr:hypothetical protein [Streptomyces sp. DSM 40971]
MSVPLGKRPSGAGGPRPTKEQLRLAHVRARATGESLAHVLSVFMGGGRYGEETGAAPTGPEAPLRPEPQEPSGSSGAPAQAEPEVGGAEQLAPVIPLSRAARGDRPGRS